ncbi:MAG TPA: SRPBCC family protein [Streptomyces sp.]
MNRFVVAETTVIDAPLGRVWDVIARTDRYAEWVAGAIEVTDHHGIATVGKTYAERNRTLGPLKTNSVWTVREIEPFRRRVDTGTGFAPLRNLVNTFEFQPVQRKGREMTEMLYRVEYVMGLGPVGKLLNAIQQPSIRAGMRTSMANLGILLRSEASRTAA